jgi:cytochrome c oxidase cbb3-type subunit III
VRPAGAGSLPGLLVLLALGCKGQAPPLVTGRPPQGVGPALVRTSELVAGGRPLEAGLHNPYEGQRNVLADGKRYYGWFNCAGCHGGAGGGGIGPPLADDDWIYGGEPANIFLTIVQGRPNGMPSYGGQIPDDQVWKIVTFVRSLSEHAAEEGKREADSGR